tara:strand:+ start:293 stop:469 length:177 start_codon:yes stop_codon:yes gene_type:complete
MQIIIKERLLIPRGNPTTVSLINPAKKTKRKSKFFKSFNVKKKIKIKGKLKEKKSRFK